jgi:hypothetical protein
VSVVLKRLLALIFQPLSLKLLLELSFEPLTLKLLQVLVVLELLPAMVTPKLLQAQVVLNLLLLVQVVLNLLRVQVVLNLLRVLVVDLKLLQALRLLNNRGLVYICFIVIRIFLHIVKPKIDKNGKTDAQKLGIQICVFFSFLFFYVC